MHGRAAALVLSAWVLWIYGEASNPARGIGGLGGRWVPKDGYETRLGRRAAGGIGAWLLVLALSVAAALPASASHGVLVAAPIEYVKRLVEAGQPPVFVDLRPADEFRRGRLPGARSLPLRELPERYPEISPLQRVVIYCSCSRQELEVAFRLLESRGYANVSVMLEGFAEWASRGYPVER